MESKGGGSMAESGGLAQLARTVLRATWSHVAFAFLAMGAWAAFANRDHGAAAMALAFVVQGALSGLLTLVLKRWLESAYTKRFATLDPWSRKLLPPAMSCATIAAVLWTAHSIAGTPEIPGTIAVPWSVSTAYAFVYTATLARRAE